MPTMLLSRLSSVLLCFLIVLLAARTGTVPTNMEDHLAQGSSLHVDECELHCNELVQCREVQGMWKRCLADMCSAFLDRPCPNALCYPIVRYIALCIFMFMTLVAILASLWR
jgi:hypothetical protein